MSFITLIILAGIGTYLIRLLPMLGGQFLAHREGKVTLFLGALGLSAIPALILVSVADLWLQQPDWRTLVSIATGASGVLLTLRLTGNVGVATLGGALVYGLVRVALNAQ